MQVPSRGRVGAMHQVLNEIAIGMANLIQEGEANARLEDYFMSLHNVDRNCE